MSEKVMAPYGKLSDFDIIIYHLLIISKSFLFSTAEYIQVYHNHRLTDFAELPKGTVGWKKGERHCGMEKGGKTLLGWKKGERHCWDGKGAFSIPPPRCLSAIQQNQNCDKPYAKDLKRKPNRFGGSIFSYLVASVVYLTFSLKLTVWLSLRNIPDPATTFSFVMK